MIIEKDKGGVISQLSYSIPNILQIQDAIEDVSLRVLPKYNAQGSKHQWTLPTAANETWQRLGSAYPELRQQILDKIEGAKQAFSALQKGADRRHLDAIFNTPDNNEFVYYRTDFDGTLTGVAMAGWGFRYPDNTQRTGVVIADAGTNIQKVEIDFINDGNPAANREFEYGLTSNAMSKLGITDKDGKCATGNFVIGLEFFIIDKQTGKKFTFTVTKGQQEYVCDVTQEKPVVETPPPPPEPEKRKVMPRLQIKNQDGSGAARHKVFVEYASSTKEFVSDEDGFIQLLQMTVEENFTVRDSTPEDYCQEYTVDEVTDPYVFQLPPALVQDNTVEEEEEEAAEEDDKNDDVNESKREVIAKLKVVDEEDNAVPNFPVLIDYADKKERIFSDKDGMVALPKMTEDDTFSVSDGFSDSNRQDYIAEADKEVYIYRLDYTVNSGNKDITIHIIDEKGKPVCKDYVILKLDDRILQCTPDEKGRIYLDNNDFERNKPITFILVQDGKEISADNFMLIQDEQEYTVQIDTMPCPWWKGLLEVLAVIGAILGLSYLFGLIVAICSMLA